MFCPVSSEFAWHHPSCWPSNQVAGQDITERIKTLMAEELGEPQSYRTMETMKEKVSRLVNMSSLKLKDAQQKQMCWKFI